MKCADVAKKLVEQAERDKSNGALDQSWVDDFKKCEDFPKPREFSIYKHADGRLEAVSVDRSFISYKGQDIPRFVCLVREIS